MARDRYRHPDMSRCQGYYTARAVETVTEQVLLAFTDGLAMMAGWRSRPRTTPPSWPR